MKVSRLDAEGVHGYLPIHIDFEPGLTFLTGLNGSGKTTALRLLMGLLAPNLDELIDIKFGSATAVVSDRGDEITLTADRTSEGLQLSTSKVDGALSLTTAELQLFVEARHREEQRTPLHEKVFAHPVFRAIRGLSTPMFLGLDRRLHMEERDLDASLLRRRELEYRRRWNGEVAARGISDAVLSDVNELVVTALSAIRAAQERLDETLRNQILLDSFRYESTPPRAGVFPERSALNSFRERQAAIEKAAANLKLPVGALQSALTDFFERITQIVDSLEKQSKSKPNVKGSKKRPSTSSPAPAHIVEWVMNSRQADRIFKQIQLLDEYVANRAKLHQPIDRFLELTNAFLLQTRKTVKVTERGSLTVSLNAADSDRGLFALSSGERQLVVMLAHLSLNPQLAQSGVFIVDEPELSLHISWQEQFVDAIQRANPNVQLILATHSPAVILERIENCRSLS